MAFIYIYATVHWYLCRVQCVCFMKTKAVDPHSNREGGLAEYSLFIKYQLKEKKTTILLIGYDRSATSTTFEHSSVALENIWRGREKERNPRRKHVELGELTGTGGQPANRSCGFQECAQTHCLSITLSAGRVSSVLPFSLSVCLTCNLQTFES